jgi:hypothetical protein
VTPPAHRVLLVRPWRDGSGGGGCCSVDPATLGGVVPHGGHDGRAGPYRLFRAELPPDVDVQIVEASNLVYLLPTVIRDARRRGRSWWGATRAALRATTPGAVVVDGQVITSSGGEHDEPEHLLQLVRATLPMPCVAAPAGHAPRARASRRSPGPAT